MATESATTTASSAPTDTSGPTGQLSKWVQSVTLADVPNRIQTRAKYIILDGLACLLVGAHLPWSQKAARTILSFEKPGTGACNVYGWSSRISPLQAALLNSTFIQGFELDDWHSEAPLHSNSLLLPSLLATAEQEADASKTTVSGKAFLLAAIVGYEVGPRIEDALGIACTQACGLMSAQFGSEAKRMQHGFAARNGLLGAYLARGGYIGIKKVFEQPYGGFLTQFSAGNGKTPNSLPDEITKNLGKSWEIEGIRLKPYASMAATHPTIDCVRYLQEHFPGAVATEKLKDVKSILIEMGSDAFHHGGWQATRPLTSLGAQMCCMYVAATQFVDSEVLVAQFEPDMLDRDVVWDLVSKTTCLQNDDLGSHFAQRTTVEYEAESGMAPIKGEVQNARGVDPEMSNEELLEKWRHLTKSIIDDEKRKQIEDLVLGLENCKDINALASLMVEINGTSSLIE